ncbi:MAG: hypothetical protein AAFQ98_10350, partial [Bacteroidota bacterium]
MMMLWCVIWGILCIRYSLYSIALIPLGCTLASVANILAYKLHLKLKLTTNFQIAISIVLPFWLQTVLGGFVPSGFVMLWSLMGLLGSTLTQGKRNTQIWYLLFMILTVVCMIYQPEIGQFKPDRFTESVSQSMFLWNLFLVLGL